MSFFDNLRDASIKRREDTERQKQKREEEKRHHEEQILNEKKVLLERNTAFFQNAMNCFLCTQNTATPWVVQQESYRSLKTRTVFIGFEYMYIYNGNPPKDKLHENRVWPEAYFFFHPDPGQGRAIDYTRRVISYPDDFDYLPISSYSSDDSDVSFTKKQVLHLVADKIYRDFRDMSQYTKLGELKSTENEQGEMFYYFTYDAPFKKLTNW